MINIIVETPRGSRQKYDYDPELRGFKLNKLMPEGMVFPFDFGYIPDTKGEDGDPLDVIIIAEFGSFTGCIIECRIIGAIKAEQKERDGDKMRNDRFLAVPAVSVVYASVNNLDELPEKLVSGLESFFKNYNKETGKDFTVIERLNAAAALALVKQN